MKADLDFLARGYIANLLRIRALRQRSLASERSRSTTRAELEAESAWCEQQATLLDDAVETQPIVEKEPIRVDGRRDIDSIDEPGKNGEK